MSPEELYKAIFYKETSISTDSRTILPGDVYFGLKGEVFDGNEYAQEALEKGARLVVIDNSEYKTNDRCILVENTFDSLKELAKIHRQQFTIPILVIGGSNGKTTTKELICALLSSAQKVHNTKGNLNNEIGVPLTILAMKNDAEIAVIEIGANHEGEHTALMNIVQPTHVLVTNNGMDHLEGFGNIAGVRKANKEIYDCARLQSATAFVNKELRDLVSDSEDMSCILYPEQQVVSTSGLYASLTYQQTAITSQLFGSFNEANMLAAIAVGIHFNIPLPAIAKAIAGYQPTLKRSQIIEKDDYTLIIDCYNANPTSMELSLKDFFATTEAGQRIIVVGDMFEVGITEQEAHKTILDLIQHQADANDVVICVGPRFSACLSSHSEVFPTFHFFHTPFEAKEYFNTLPFAGKKIFLKASRGIKLEAILS